MRKSLLFFAAASLLLAGCAKEQLVEEKISNGVVTEVSATFEALVPDGATKASVSISENTGTFSWQEDDAAAFVLDSKTAYGKGTYNATSKMFQIQGAANSHHDAVYPDDLVGLTSPSTEHVTSVTVPSTRVWAANQTNVAMYGTYTSDKYTFKHLGGLVKVTVVNVPTTAKTFVFKTAGKKINGTFAVEPESTTSTENVIKTSDSPETDEDIYTLNLPSTITANSTMDFYVPLPVGDGYKFAFYLKDNSSNDLVKIEGTTEQTVTRRSILVMPTITLAAASIEDIYKSATIQEVPAGHSGDFLLAKSESVILKLMSSTDDKDITLKYNGVELPKNLKIVVEGDKYFDAKISGNLPKTHVDFTEGEIKEAAFTTNNSTFSIVYPAKISDKLTVGGGNVVIEGAKVGAIEVAEGAKADPTGGTGNVKITMKAATVESQKIKPEIVGAIVAKANIEVAPAKDVEVYVAPAQGVEVKKDEGSQGEVIPVTDRPVMIGSTGYDNLAAAINAVTEGQTIKVLKDISDADGISVAKNANKKFTVDFGGHTYTCLDNPTGSTSTTNQVFQLNAGNTITFKNGTINVAETNNTKFRFIIQNYADLTLEDMTLDGTNLAINKDRYTLSNNAGNINLTGKTSITAAAENGTAFDIYYWPEGGYSTAPVLTWNSTGDVEGRIELAGATFIVEKDLKVTTPIRAIKNANGQAKLTVKAGATIYPSKKFSGNVQTAFANSNNGYKSFNEYAGGVVIVNRGANLLINGDGKISTTSNEEWCYSAVCLTEKGESESASTDADRAKLTVEGNVTLEGYYYGVVGNGSRYDTDITINGGTIKGIKANDCTGIYHPQKGNLTISGGTIEGATGVYVKSGDVKASVSAGTIKGVGTNCKAYDPARKGDGCDPTGDALVIDNCGYPGGTPTVSILGGTFISTNHKAVASYAKTGYPTVTGFINGGTFSDLSGVKYVADNATYTLGADVDNAKGMIIDTKKTFTVDFGGHTYTVNKPGAGSINTQTSAFQLLKDQTITFKNGTIRCHENNKSLTWETGKSDVEKGIAMIIQDYAKLTLEKMTIDGTNIAHNGNNVRYMVSSNYGDINFTGNTSIIAPAGDFAFDAYDNTSDSYPNVPTVTWNSTGSVTGNIELAGGKLVIASNLGYANTIMATEGTSILEVNATLSATDASDWYLVKAGSNGKSGVVLNISGTGTLSSGTSVHCIPVTSDYGAQVNISGGDYKCYGDGECVYANRDGKVSISGGTFGVREGDTVKDLLNVQNDQDVTDIQCTGGTFHGKNPADGDDAKGSSFVAPGYVSTETTEGSKVWTVSEQN